MYIKLFDSLDLIEDIAGYCIFDYKKKCESSKYLKALIFYDLHRIGYVYKIIIYNNKKLQGFILETDYEKLKKMKIIE